MSRVAAGREKSLALTLRWMNSVLNAKILDLMRWNIIGNWRICKLKSEKTGIVHSFGGGCNSFRVKGDRLDKRQMNMSYNVPHFSVAQPCKWGLDRLIVEVSRSHSIGRTHLLGFLWKGEQPDSYTTHKEHKRRTSMPLAEFEPAIPAIKRLQTYASDTAATVMVSLSLSYTVINPYRTNVENRVSSY